MKEQDYSDLSETGFSGVDVKAPEDEFFHSVYISGQSRANHIGTVEDIGKFQVRGVIYNQSKVYMIITHIKEILAKLETDSNQKEVTKCFCYKTGPEWIGTTGRKCGRTSSERAANDFCKDCKSQIIVAGLLCDVTGKPITGADGKAAFGFIRGKGIKYSPVSEYLNGLFKEDLSPIFTPVTDESKRFEKSVVNHKRFVTEIGVGSTKTAYGMKTNFTLTKGKQLSDDDVKKIIRISKETLSKFNDKFDWSKRNTKQQSSSAPLIPFEENKPATPTPQAAASQEDTPIGETGDAFSFDDITF